MASAIIGAVGDLLVLIALVVAVRALNTANGARADARTSDKAASDARIQAADREIESVRLAKDQLEQARTAAADADGRAQEAAARAEAAAIAQAERDESAFERGVARDQEAFLERRYERVLTVSQIVEGMFWAIQPYMEPVVSASTGIQRSAADVPRDIWMPARNALRHRLGGLKEALPSCQRIVDAGTAFQAYDACALSRNEVEVELQRIDAALDELRAAFRVRLSGAPDRFNQPPVLSTADSASSAPGTSA